MKISVALFGLSIILLSGCTTPLQVIDVSDSVYHVPSSIASSIRPVSKIVITADAASRTNDGRAFSDVHLPIRGQVATADVVASDLSAYLNQVLSIDARSTRSVDVLVKSAGVYWVISPAEKVPFVLLATAGAERDISMDIEIHFAVEDDGRVMSTYFIKDTIVVRGKAGTQEQMRASYKIAIAAYRQKIFQELDARFVPRYF